MYEKTPAVPGLVIYFFINDTTMRAHTTQYCSTTNCYLKVIASLIRVQRWGLMSVKKNYF